MRSPAPCTTASFLRRVTTRRRRSGWCVSCASRKFLLSWTTMARDPKGEISQLLGTAERFLLLDFRNVNGLATREQKREQMLARCQEIYERADQRERQSGKGAAFADPDCHAMVKCVELSAKL